MTPEHRERANRVRLQREHERKKRELMEQLIQNPRLFRRAIYAVVFLFIILLMTIYRIHTGQ